LTLYRDADAEQAAESRQPHPVAWIAILIPFPPVRL
jgi:hypothetical protein